LELFCPFFLSLEVLSNYAAFGWAQFKAALRHWLASTDGHWVAGTDRFRTNTFSYATNNIDLVAWTDALGVLVESNIFNAGVLPRRVEFVERPAVA
jgi:hypothetical protein